MKTIISLGAILVSISSWGQINVPQIQKSLYASVDATWCGNCGNVGLPSTAAIYSDVNDKAVFFELHASSSSALYSTTAESLSNEFGVNSYPRVTLNGVDKGALKTSVISTLTSDINNNYDGSSTLANAGFEWRVENDSIIVDVNTTFFDMANGEFLTGVYITEDSIWEYQANYDPAIPNGNIYHFHILRDVLSTNVHGKSTGNGSINAGDEFLTEHKIKVNSDWKLNNIHINTVIWKKTGSDYEVVNTNNIGSALTPNLSLENNKGFESIGISPNPSSNIINLSIDNSEISHFEIIDNLGRKIRTIRTTKTIDISALDQGQYQLIGRNGKTILARSSFIKQ